LAFFPPFFFYKSYFPPTGFDLFFLFVKTKKPPPPPFLPSCYRERQALRRKRRPLSFLVRLFLESPFFRVCAFFLPAKVTSHHDLLSLPPLFFSYANGRFHRGGKTLSPWRIDISLLLLSLFFFSSSGECFFLSTGR